MKRLYSGSIVLSVAAALASPVLATSTSTATVDDLTVTIYSTRKGVTPTISFGSPANSINGNLVDTSNSEDPSYGYPVTYTGSNTISTPLTHETSSISGSGTFALSTDTTFYATGSAAGGGIKGNTYEASAYTDATSFKLGADTVAVFSATGITTAETSQLGDNAYALASLEIQSSGGSPFFQYYTDITSIGKDGTNQTQTDPLTLIVGNFSCASITGFLTVDANASGIDPVPEPASYALMAVGLGFLGVVAERRRPRKRFALRLSVSGH